MYPAQSKLPSPLPDWRIMLEDEPRYLNDVRVNVHKFERNESINAQRSILRMDSFPEVEAISNWNSLHCPQRIRSIAIFLIPVVGKVIGKVNGKVTPPATLVSTGLSSNRVTFGLPSNK